MSKRKVRAENIGFWFNQYKQGVSSEDAIKANISYSGYFLYQKEKDKIFESDEGLQSVHVQPEDKDAFEQFLTQFELVNVPKYARGGGGPRGNLNTVEVAKEKGVSEENIPAYIDAMNELYAAKKKVNDLLDGLTVAVSIPNRKKKDADPVNGDTGNSGT